MAFHVRIRGVDVLGRITSYNVCYTKLLRKFAGVTTRLLPQLVHPKHVDGPVGARVRAMAARVGGEAFLRQQRAILARPDFRPGLSRIRVPTWVAVGDSDVLTPPAEAHEIFLEIANATVITSYSIHYTKLYDE